MLIKSFIFGKTLFINIIQTIQKEPRIQSQKKNQKTKDPKIQVNIFLIQSSIIILL